MWWWLGAALAQTPPVPDVNAQLYRPPVDARQTLWTDDAGRIFKRPWGSARVYGQYVYLPFAWEPAQGDPVKVVSDVLELDLVPAVAYDRFRLGLHLPIYLLSTSQVTGGGAGLGDLALDLRGTLLDDRKAPVGLAITARGFLGTGTVDAPLATPGPGLEVAGVVDGKVDALLLAANVGVRFLPEAAMAGATLDDPIFVRLGGGYRLGDGGGLSLDLAGQAATSAPLSNPSSVPIEALLGGWIDAGRATIRLGAGRGLTTGIGAPGLRVVASVGFEAKDEKEKAPPKREPKVRETIDLDGRVYFESGKATLLPESYPVLDKVAKQMTNHPEFARVRVEGHTDAQGTEAFNQELSQRRAETVRNYLISKGIAGKRLEALGYGESRPLGDDFDANRRVEFVILKRTDQPAGGGGEKKGGKKGGKKGR